MERELGMLMKHRKHIENNIDDLMRHTNYLQLMAECVRRGLLSPVMRSSIEGFKFNKNEEEVQFEHHKQLFIKITKRGPTAYAELIAALRFVGSAIAISILESVDEDTNGSAFRSIHESKRRPNVSSATQNNNVMPDSSDGGSVSRTAENDTLTPYTKPTPGQTRVVRKSTKIHSDDAVGVYPMRSEHNRGVLFMVNIIDFPDETERRNGADKDGEALIHLFREFGFKIFAYNNLTQGEFFRLLKALTDSDHVRDIECFVMAFMTHGGRVNETDKVQFHCGSVANVRSIIDHFAAYNCPSLQGIPKVLLFPCCRGKGRDKGVYKRRSTIQTDGWSDGQQFNNVPTSSDIIVCYASTPGYEAHREPDTGTWYIQQLCDMMANHAHNKHLEDILKMTQFEVSKMRTVDGDLQTAAYDNIGFSKHLYFNPGFFE